MSMTRIEAIAWCLLAVVLTAAGFGLYSVWIALLIGLLARWAGEEIISAFRSVFGGR